MLSNRPAVDLPLGSAVDHALCGHWKLPGALRNAEKEEGRGGRLDFFFLDMFQNEGTYTQPTNRKWFLYDKETTHFQF